MAGGCRAAKGCGMARGVQDRALGAPAGLCRGRLPPAAGGAAHLGGAGRGGRVVTPAGPRRSIP